MAKLELELEMSISHIEINAVIQPKIKGRSNYQQSSFWIFNLSKEQFEEMIELYNEKHKENENT